MAIRTKLKDFTPTKDKFKREITLLSRGFYCGSSFPNGKITVYPWDSAVDEWIVKLESGSTASFLAKATEKLANLNGCPVGNMTVGDANSVLLVARSMQNNCVYSTTPVCPECRYVHKEESIRIPDDLKKVGEKSADWTGTDLFILYDCGDDIVIHPLLIRDLEFIDSRDHVSQAMISNRVATLLRSIVSIGGGQPDTLEELNNWYSALSPSDQVQLKTSIDELTPHLDTAIDFTCDACRKPFSIKIDLNKEFFRPRSRTLNP